MMFIFQGFCTDQEKVVYTIVSSIKRAHRVL